jgi:LysR family transcriptional regulator, glycine cleavage system transcriptional activator
MRFVNMADISKSNISSTLPPLATLPAFEAAARFGSFSKAAQHLGSSQPAISQQIRQLEAAVGRKLFQRKSQGVGLTPAGEELLQAVRTGFAALRQTMASLRQPARRAELTVATDFAFAAYWLLPRLAAFKHRMPEVDVRILTAQHVDDLGDAAADVAILFGTGPAHRDAGSRHGGKLHGGRLRPLFAETVYPVCAPAYPRGAVQGRPDWLAEATLLNLDDLAALPQNPPAASNRRAERWFTWADWLRDAEVAKPMRGPQLHFNNYTLVLQAAMAGQGIALGWAPLVEPLIASDQLQRAHHHACRSSRGYFLSRADRHQVSAVVDDFVTWLQAEAAVA